MRICLEILVGDDNYLVRTTQMLIGHQIRELDRFSHFEKGSILVVKSKKINNNK
jgi:hypothetical protein